MSVILTFLQWAGARLTESATYAGLAGLFTLLHLTVPGWAPQVIQIVGMAIGSVLAIVIPNATKPAS